MRRFTNWSRVGMAVGVIALGAYCVRAAEEKDEAKKIKESDVPQKVMDAVKARFPNAKIDSVEREKEDGNVIYDIELTQDGRKYETDVKEDGTLLEVEKALDAKDWPANVTQAVMAKYPRTTIKEVMEKSLVKDGKETVHEYEVVIRYNDSQEKELTVTPEGKITAEAPEADKKDKDDKKRSFGGIYIANEEARHTTVPGFLVDSWGSANSPCAIIASRTGTGGGRHAGRTSYVPSCGCRGS